MQKFSNHTVLTPSSDDNASQHSQDAKMGISIIIPAYNERDRIKKSLDNYIPVIESFNLPYEIIVVIDGNDGTEDVIRNYKNLDYFKSSVRLGKGGAVKKGLLMADEVSTVGLLKFCISRFSPCSDIFNHQPI